MRYLIITLSMLVFPPIMANAGVDVGFSIGINVPVYPQLVAVPGFPVYYDPDLDSNYFFYDGQYWVYVDDNWYTSDWYNGPWMLVEPEYVPLFILRVPVRYYRHPPVYFTGWSFDAAPHWGEHWGHEWEEHHRNWNHWDHHSIPRAAPLPVYQRQYSGDRYPHGVKQRAIRNQQYHYRPRVPLMQHGQPNNAVDRGELSHPPAPVQRQREVRPQLQPNPSSRPTESFHRRLEHPEQRNMLPGPSRVEQRPHPHEQHVPHAPQPRPQNHDHHEEHDRS